MIGYPVHVDIKSPQHFDRIQLLLRFLVTLVFAWLGITGGWLVWVLYATLPLIAAIVISSDGRESFTRDVAPPLWRALRWLLELSAYMLFATDRFPTADGHSVHADIRFTGAATVPSALVRLLTSIPSALVLGLLSIVSWLLCVISIVTVLIAKTVPASILAFQRGIVQWQGRLLAYHASLVEEYPPFSFSTLEVRTHGA